MTGKPTKFKKKKITVLAAKGVRVVESDKEEPPPDSTVKRKVVVGPSKNITVKRIRRTGPGTPSTRPRTQRVDLTQQIQLARESQALRRNSPTAEPIDLEDPEVHANRQEEPMPPPPELQRKAESRKESVEAMGEPTFKFFCYRCGQKLMVPVSWANKGYPCGRCGHDIVIPPPLVGNVW